MRTDWSLIMKSEGDFPRYGNDDDRADDIAVWLLKTFMGKIEKRHTYRDSEPTTSILTITSNVVYGKATGSDAGWPQGGRTVVSGREPILRRRAERSAGFSELSCQAAV